MWMRSKLRNILRHRHYPVAYNLYIYWSRLNQYWSYLVPRAWRKVLAPRTRDVVDPDIYSLEFSQSTGHEIDYSDYIEAQVKKTLGRLDISLAPRLYVRDASFKYFRRYTDFPMESRVLCVGCRDMTEIFYIRSIRPKFKVRGVDLVSCHPDIACGDIHDLPFNDESFDITIASHVLEHTYDIETAISEILRVTTPGGFIHVEIPVRFNTDEVDRISLDSVDSLIEIFRGSAKIDIVHALDRGLSPGIAQCLLKKQPT